MIESLGLGKRYAYQANSSAAGSEGAQTEAGSLEEQKYFWALRDLSFEVKQGEVVGIIGKNGAGKSTLLKILSRITSPTCGKAVLKGRVSSLLEIGTGFHPDLTGRENIFINGAILGMKKREIESKLDQIAAFSEIGVFLDTPVKHYSTGMYMRLAFSVAAHLDSEIMFIDEALAVGDMTFQKKCFDRIEELVRDKGRTILLVSHNMTAVRRLASRAMVLDRGRMIHDGTIEKGISYYLPPDKNDFLHAMLETAHLDRPAQIAKESGLRIDRVELASEGPKAIIKTQSPLKVNVFFHCRRPLQEVGWGFYIETSDGLRLLDLKSTNAINPFETVQPGHYRVSGWLESHPLAPGEYYLGVGARDKQNSLDWLPRVVRFKVEEGRTYESKWFQETSGIFRQEASWDEPVLLSEKEVSAARL